MRTKENRLFLEKSTAFLEKDRKILEKDEAKDQKIKFLKKHRISKKEK